MQWYGRISYSLYICHVIQGFVVMNLLIPAFIAFLAILALFAILTKGTILTSRGDMLNRKFVTAPAISPFSTRITPSRVNPVSSIVIGSTSRRYHCEVVPGDELGAACRDGSGCRSRTWVGSVWSMVIAFAVVTLIAWAIHEVGEVRVSRLATKGFVVTQGTRPAHEPNP